MIVREFINLIGFDLDQQAFNATENKVKGLLDKMESFGTKATLFLTAPFIAMSAAAIKMASSAEETQNKFNAVFGGISDQANIWAVNYADSLDRVDSATKDSLSIFQSMFVGLGATTDAAFKMSKRIISLGDDLSSFADKDPSDIQNRFLSAMTGSSEVVDQFGINLKVAALQTFALSQGITKSVQKMTEFEKSMLRLDIIEDTMGRQGAIGDAIKTSKDFANRLRSAKDQVIKTAISFGKILLPAALKIVNVFIDLNKRIQKINPTMKRVLLILAGMLALLGPLTLAFIVLVKVGLGVQKMFVLLAVAAKGANLSMGLMLIKFALIGAAVIAVIAALAFLTDDIINFVKGNKSLIGEFLEPWETLGPKIKKALQPVIDGAMNLWMLVKGIFTDIGDFIRAVLADDTETAAVAFADIIEKYIGIVIQFWKTFAQFLFIFGKFLITKIIKNLPGALLAINKVFRNLLLSILKGLTRLVLEQLSNLKDKALSIFTDLKDKFNLGNLFGDDTEVTVNRGALGLPDRGAIGQALGGSSTSNKTNNVTNTNSFNIPLAINVPEGTSTEQTSSIASNVQKMVKNAFETEINNLAFSSGAVQ